MVEQFKTIKSKVKHLLEKYPNLRNSDPKLIATIWHYESRGVENKMAFLRFFAEGRYSSPESIRRMRQKIQEENPHLRGDVYKYRTGQGERAVREHLRN